MSHLPTVGQNIKVPFYTDKQNNYEWIVGSIKIERDNYWIIQLTDGEVHKIQKTSKWIQL